jgi:Domain of unknown function (DUF4825)
MIMNRRNKLILALLVVGVVLFSIIEGYVIPANEEKAEQYQRNQQNPLTHDLQSILPYKSKYMGSTRSTVLFTKLPLNQLESSFQLDPDQFKIQIKYQAIEEMDTDKVEQSLLYNSLAAFALIDNLQILEYHFPHTTYQAKRADVEQIFGAPLGELLTEEKWKKVQKRWADAAFLTESMEKVFAN